ncbi:MAG: RNA methyltransferase, partial [Myxococcales bacterium]|nr:RNA methyltransferase [Myxococcales bacterium]
VEPIRPYDEALAAFAAGEGQHLVLVPTGGRPLDAALLAGEAPIVFVVGPEGGLSADEIALAAQLGYQPATLGPFVMRTETACAAMLGAILAAR